MGKESKKVKKYIVGGGGLACSKSIRSDFFPRILMKHRRCAVIGRWRVPSCAYVDFFPTADSVSRVQPACE